MESTAQKLSEKKSNRTKTISYVVLILLGLSSIGGAQYWNHHRNIQNATAMQVEIAKERAITCPALLSIAKSPRDTLIVMKNKPVCIQYVFEKMGK